ncbi:hemagglutination repeat-containing protein [Beauveria brongniartii RCEF 3172]|uniref:Hemagglutination repeat-containing protein n=1 Tax=Beauveria brongniartii RCEF 3172 TaxID=1081107 RepID=A0A167ICR2_9HYPO|nr:hemagglutination repeat-containing protein [Beauveria brongniartii RCEF 3172]
MKFLTALTLTLPSLAASSAINGLLDASITGGAAVATSPDRRAGSCLCNGATAASDGADFLCGDKRLGPKQLPTMLPLGSFVASYNRLGSDDITVDQFLAAWTGPDGRYRYPPQNGFTLDVHGDAINGTLTLEVGTLIDRFGSEYGSYVSAASAPFSQRSLPPSSLDADPKNPDFPYGYHLYKVLRPFAVVGGPIAPWFGQPGLGAQFYTGGLGNIMKLIEDGYIERQDPSILVTQSQGACTQSG